MDKDDSLDSIVIAAATLLAGSVHEVSSDGGRTTKLTSPTGSEIQYAVQVAKRIRQQASNSR